VNDEEYGKVHQYTQAPNDCFAWQHVRCVDRATKEEVGSQVCLFSVGTKPFAGPCGSSVDGNSKATSSILTEPSLTDYQRQFLKGSLQDFERAGLALSEEDGAKLKQLLEQDAAVCAEYGKNLGADTTKILFTPEELQGCGDDFIQERLNDDDEAAAGKYCTITP
jgi:hypothetical protein